MQLTQLSGNDKIFIWFTSIAVFLFFAISLIVPSGYSVGAALLFLAGLTILFRRNQWPVLGKEDRILLIVFLIFFLTWIAEIVLDGQSSSRYDKPIRIICAGIALLWLMRYPPKVEGIWAGISVGGMTVGAWAAWQKLVLHVDRADGYTHVIQFGNISMLLGMLSLAGIGWAWIRKRSYPWMILLLLGFFGGVIGSLFSGSRGGWVGVPFILLVIFHGYRQYLSRRLIIASLVAGVLAVTSLFLIPKTGIKNRVQEAVVDITQYYNNGVTTTSLGARFEMWKFGAMAFMDSPVYGFGQLGLRDFKEGLIAEGKVSDVVRQFDHLHNEYVDTAARRGLIGLLALLAVYLVPLRLFMARSQAASIDIKPYAVGGAILCVSFMDFSLSQSFFSHNSGVMMYFFTMVIFWSALSRATTLQCRCGKPPVSDYAGIKA